jgi:hypothetical protein
VWERKWLVLLIYLRRFYAAIENGIVEVTGSIPVGSTNQPRGQSIEGLR